MVLPPVRRFFMSRILLLYASSGSGHRSAAYGLAEAFRHQGVADVRVENTLDYGPSFYRELYGDFYQELSEKAPQLWEYAYKLTDKTEEDPHRILEDMRVFLDRTAVTGLHDLIASYQPDAIVCTHFQPLPILAEYRSQGKLAQPVFCVVTDYTGNAKWVSPVVDSYFVATPLVRKMLVERGASEQLIAVAGIPVDPAITQPKDQSHLRQVYEIEKQPVVTLIGSALAEERVRWIIQDLLQREIKGTLFIVAGRNADLQKRLSDLQGSPTLDLRILGFVDELDDLVALSDLVITKSGGLIVSEVMARHTPMLILDPIPGQEHWNADYVVGVGAGVQVRLAEMVPFVVEQILNDTERLNTLRDHARSFGRPRAAHTIARAVLQTRGDRPMPSMQ
jgi:processive 1,2-diacylglycerol beta-glucosyltransferase